MSFFNLNISEQKKILEALIFTSEEPLSVDDILKLLLLKINKDESKNNLNIEDEIVNLNSHYKNVIENLINEINQDLENTGRPFNIIFSGGTYKYAVTQDSGELLIQYSKFKSNKRFSQASLEVLAIIAYNQPISKPEIEQIRGINSNEVVNSLLEKNLIKISGKSDIIGKPLLYSTTEEFLRTFNLSSLDELPKLKEFDEVLDNINKNISENPEKTMSNGDFEFIKFVNKDELNKI